MARGRCFRRARRHRRQGHGGRIAQLGVQRSSSHDGVRWISGPSRPFQGVRECGAALLHVSVAEEFIDDVDAALNIVVVELGNIRVAR